jgi:hypothetical protein
VRLQFPIFAPRAAVVCCFTCSALASEYVGSNGSLEIVVGTWRLAWVEGCGQKLVLPFGKTTCKRDKTGVRR